QLSTSERSVSNRGSWRPVSIAAIVGWGILLRRARARWVSPALRLARLRSPLAAAPCLIMNSLSHDHATAYCLVADAGDARVERVADRIAEQVHAEDNGHDREAGEHRQPPRDTQIFACLGQHQTPLSRRWLGAEAEERQRG